MKNCTLNTQQELQKHILLLLVKPALKKLAYNKQKESIRMQHVGSFEPG